MDLIDEIFNQSLHWVVPDVPPLLERISTARLELGDIVYLDTSPLKDGKRNDGDAREEYAGIITKITDKGYEVQDLEENDGPELVEEKERFVHVIDAAEVLGSI